MPRRAPPGRDQEILRRWTNGEGMREIAPDYGVSAARIGDIVRATRATNGRAPRRHLPIHLRRTKAVIESAIGLARLWPDEVAAVLAEVWASRTLDFEAVIRADHAGIQTYMDGHPLAEPLEEPDAPT